MIIFIILYDGSQNFYHQESREKGLFREEGNKEPWLLYVSLTSEETGMEQSPLYL